MKKLSFKLCLATLAFAALALPLAALAHHSFAMYDTKLKVTFTGKLTRFVVGANHSQFIFEAMDESGKPIIGADGKQQTWGVETGPASTIAKQGVTVVSFPVGTYFTVSLNPLRDGRTFGVLTGGIIICTAELPVAGCTRETGKVFLER